MKSHELTADAALLKKYSVAGPRYTSYPTAPVFTEAFGADQYLASVDHSNVAAKPLSLYFHLPYCRTLCYYCGCNMKITHSRDTIATYVSHLKREIGMVAKRIDTRRQAVQLHWGGGSPSYLLRTEKLDLIAFIKDHFNFAPNAEIGTELDPRDVEPGDAESLHQAGFNRVSFGLQDFNPEVQKAVNRVHSEEVIRRIFGDLRDAGFESINVDLIYGLPKQTPQTFSVTIDKMIDMNPDRIAVFNFAYLPEMIKHQTMLNPADFPSTDQKIDMLKMTIEKFTRGGYEYIGMDHFAKPDDELCVAQRNKTLYRNFQGYSTHSGCDMFAFGNSAIGQVDGAYCQNQKDIPEYFKRIDGGRPATAKGYQLNRDDLLRHEIIQRVMCDLELDLPALERKWEFRFLDYFKESWEALAPLEVDGLVKRGSDKLIVTSLGRLFIRNIAMVFDQYLKVQQGKTKYSKTV